MDLDSRHYDSIDSTDIYFVAVSDSDIHKILLSYLVHNCFKETVESFICCTGIKQPADCFDDIDRRKRIIKFVLDGNVLKAIEVTEASAPDLLEKNEDLHFDLLSLHFVDLVCSRKCTEALEFAQNKLTLFGKIKKYMERLEDFMALLAYEEPEKSPMFHLLSQDYRQDVADKLNQAILAHANQPSYSSLERLIQQTTAVRQQLSQEHGQHQMACHSCPLQHKMVGHCVDESLEFLHLFLSRISSRAKSLLPARGKQSICFTTEELMSRYIDWSLGPIASVNHVAIQDIVLNVGPSALKTINALYSL